MPCPQGHAPKPRPPPIPRPKHHEHDSHTTPSLRSGETTNTTGPTATITLADTALTAGETTTVTFTFSEPVTGFDASDVVLTDANGTLGALTANADGKTWTATFTPTNDIEDSSNTIRVNLAGVTNAAGRAGTGSVASTSYAMDTKRPDVVSLTFDKPKLRAGESTTATITFSEALNRDSFTLAKLNPPPDTGTLSNLHTTDGITWTFTLTAPASGRSGTGVLGIQLSNVTDVAGNTGITRYLDQSPYVLDFDPPTATITLADNALTAGETTTVTFTFSEPVNGFNASDVVLTDANGTLGALTPNATRTVWTATFTPTANVNAAANTIRVNLSGVRDDAGNAGTSTATSATYTVDTRPDTTPPVIDTATVNGNQLVLTYTEANTLDPAALTGSAGYAVSSSTGTAITVRSAVVNGTAKTVTLTLSRAVTHTETVQVSYTKPESGAVVQDAAGNDAANLSDRAVMNNTPNPDAPQLITTGDDRPSVVGWEDVQLRFSHSNQGNAFDESHGPAKGDFTVLVDGVPNAVNEIVLFGTSNATLLTLVLKNPLRHGQKVTVSYQDSTPLDGNGIQDTAGNRLASIPTTEAVNTRPDMLAPELITTDDTRGPKVTGDQLVLSYEDSSKLQGRTFADNAGFTVSSATGPSIAVTGAVVDATAKTVTLTLSRAVAQGEALSVSYTKPATGHAVQDAVGHGAANFSDQAVTNNTLDTMPPAFHSAAVNGDQLVIRYTEANTLDGATLADNAGFTVSSTTGIAITVRSAAVNATDKTVTLTLSRSVANGETVNVSYTQPTSGAVVQDAAGNDAADFSNRAVTNNTPDTTPPAIYSATVNGDQLVISYAEANTLDPVTLAGNAGFTASSSTGIAITVRSATVSAGDKTVTLTLSRSVANGETVNVSYTKPTSGAVVQDTAGNDAADFSNRAVTNNTPDTTPPAIHTATVNGDQLVLTYTEANTLDPAALTDNAGYAVSSTTGTAITVNSAAVNGAAKTVTLTLSRSVAHGETVNVSYTKPTSGAVVQDAAGNDAADFSSRAVTNNTPDNTAPQLITTSNVATGNEHQLPTVSGGGSNLVLTFSDTSNLNGDADRKPAAGDFTVSVDGAARTVNSVTVNATGKIILLALATPVAAGQHVTVAYQDSTPDDGKGIQDTANNRLASFQTTEAVNNVLDMDAPQLITTGAARPTASGNQLVLRFSDVNNLSADLARKPAAGDFSVLVAGVANAVTAVAVNGADKTITLTLSTAVTPGQTTTVAYTDSTPNDTSAIQDAKGNSLTRFAATQVNTPDTTPPEFSSAAVNGNQLVISYTEANTLDAAALTGNAGFTVSSTTGTAITVNSAVVNGAAKTVTLTLSRAVTQAETVKVSYTKPESGAVVQDAAGNDAADFSSQAVSNNTPATPADPTAPHLITTGTAGPRVLGSDLVLEFSAASNLDAAEAHKPLRGDFTVLVDGAANTVASVTVGANGKLVYLTLSTSVRHGQSVSIAYNDSTPTDASAIQDTAGNRLTSFSSTAVDNRAQDRESPQLITTGDHRPQVTGNQLVLSFGDTSHLNADPTRKPANGAFTVLVDGVANAVTHVTIDAQTKTVTLTLTTAVSNGQSVTVAYTDPTSGDDANAIQDATGNDAASFAATAVVNNTRDTTPPLLHSATVTGDQLVLTYTESNSLDPAALAGNAGFTVSSSTGTAITVRSATVSATDKTVTLTLSRAVANGETVNVSYTKPATGAVVQDAAGNDAADFGNRAVSNNTPDTTPPAIHSATVTGDQLVLTYTETNSLDPAALAGNAGFTVSSSTGTAITVRSATVSATDKTVTLTLSRAVANGETVNVSYTKPATGAVVQDAAGNDAADFGSRAVTNNMPTPADTTPPLLGDVTVNGNQLELRYTDANQLDASHIALASAFALSSSGAAAIRVSSVAVTGKTVTLTLSRAVASNETLTLSYTKPATGDNAIQDAIGNDAASFGDQAVENLTPAPAPAPGPGPAPAPAPEKNPGAPNADHDDVPDAQENQAIGPKGSAPGDGNNDGIQDSAQAAVASFSAKTSSGSGTSVTLVADSQNGKLPSSSSTRITSLEQKAAPAQTPKALETPIALTSFKATLETAGSTETFSLYVDSALGANGYWLQDHSDTWVNLASSPYGGKMVDEGGRLRLDFTITDGGQFDADGKADGVITAPGAAAQMPLSIVGQAPDGTHDGFWF
ncbi:SwmB domain-containing protein [Verminephrobacter aporrectodeae]|uniref:SwmB domain-containing protein n=1 Tax=Verminephrobacter aporrectodeae TaxID=1110389 RepID=UPI002AA29FBD|nr:SwmB domain-containing protein [Verminephrobacter aporrectodeae]